MTITLSFTNQNGSLSLNKATLNGKETRLTSATAGMTALMAKIAQQQKEKYEQLSSCKKLTATLQSPSNEKFTLKIVGESKIQNYEITIHRLSPDTVQAFGNDLALLFPPKPALEMSPLKTPLASPAETKTSERKVSFSPETIAPPAFSPASALSHWIPIPFTSHPSSAAPSQNVSGVRGLSNPDTTCFMNATFQMVMNDDALHTALEETYTELLDENQKELKTLESHLQVLQSKVEKEGKEWFAYFHKSYQEATCAYGEAKNAHLVCVAYQNAYQTLLKAIKLYRSGRNERIDLTPLRFLLAIDGQDNQEICGLEKGSMGDSHEFFMALFSRVDLEKYPHIGAVPGYRRTYTHQDQTPIENLDPKTLDLQVQIEPNKTGQKLVDELFALKKIKKEDAAISKEWGPMKTEKRLFIDPPERLLIHLKRFTPQREIITSSVPMPEQLLIEGKKYHLTSIVHHSGIHYVAYIKKNGSWYKANDSTVTEANDLATGLNYGYLYFYVLESSLHPID